MMLLPPVRRCTLRPTQYQVPTDPFGKMRREAGPTGHGPGSYRLELGPKGAIATAADEAGHFYASRTLAQILRTEGPGPLAARTIEDWPDFPVRGLSLDVSRGRVPTLSSLFTLAERLADLKMNQLQLYIEHTFTFQSHPLIGEGCSPLTPDDLKALDTHCAALHIELVPCFASLGHLSRILALPPYRALAEDQGRGLYSRPNLDPAVLKQVEPGWTLSPVNENAYKFLDQLFADLLPSFRSRRFNACCDEPFDLGWGQSRQACERDGIAAVFARHVRRVQSLAKGRGKDQLLIWADLPQAHSETLHQLPKDVTLLDWKYNDDSDFKALGQLTRAGFEAWASPSTNSWGCFYPRLPMALANIDRYSTAALEQGAKGFLNTIWGDGGHYNPLACDWPAIARGAERAWNASAEADGFLARYAKVLLSNADPSLPAALSELGDLSTAVRHGGTASLWAEALFKPMQDPFFQEPRRVFYRGVGGQVWRGPGGFDGAYMQRARERLTRLQEVLASAFSAGDRLGTKDDVLLSVEAMALAAEKFFLNERRPSVKAAQALEARGLAFRERFVANWLRNDRPSEIQITLKKLDQGRA